MHAYEPHVVPIGPHIQPESRFLLYAALPLHITGRTTQRLHSPEAMKLRASGTPTITSVSVREKMQGTVLPPANHLSEFCLLIATRQWIAREVSRQ
nr:hypothetical protein CFP56_10940 [Quercus suber]